MASQFTILLEYNYMVLVVLAQSISTFLYFFEILDYFNILFTISGIGSFPTSAILPAKIEIITFVFFIYFF